MNQEKVGKFIKEIRKKNNLTQSELAGRLGVTYQAVSKWENGKNIPDISLLKEISSMFNVDITDLLNGEIKEKKKDKKIYIVMIIFIILILILIFLLINNHSDGFKFKTITSNCDEFEVSGSAAYNKDKTSIYISDVNYCGEKNNTVYKSIECNLYETYGDITTKISSCNTSGNKTLTEFLDDIKINVDNYLSSCKEFSNSKLYLEINAIDKNNKNTYYKIPITLKDNCSIINK